MPPPNALHSNTLQKISKVFQRHRRGSDRRCRAQSRRREIPGGHHLTRRRGLLAGGGSLAVAAAADLAAPAIAQGLRELKMVTEWPESMPGLLASSRRFAQTIGEATGGRIKIEVFPVNGLVRAFESFDAVGAGVADMYHAFEGYFEQKSRALNFFSAIPFGLTANELFAWISYGGGQELWDELGGRFNIKPFLVGSTGCQMGGWFVREMTSVKAFQGLRYRMGGPGTEVLRRLGALVVTLSGGDIMQALQSGAIDASEWIGPWLDMAIGLHKAASYYYYPAFHEPGTAWSLGINKGVWESFSASDQRLIATAAAAEYSLSLAEMNSNNALSLRQLRQEGRVKILRFDDATLKTLHQISDEVVAEIGAGDELSRKIYASYRQFRDLIRDWSDISERAYMDSRGA